MIIDNQNNSRSSDAIPTDNLTYDLLYNHIPSIELDSPENGEIVYEDIYSTFRLKFNIDDGDNDDVKYDLFLDTDPNCTALLLENQEATYSNDYGPENLFKKQTYYWKIIVDDGYSTTESKIFSFFMANRIPTIELDSPENGEIVYEESYPPFRLEFTIDDGDNDDVKYDLYLDTYSNCTALLLENQEATYPNNYEPENLLKRQYYYWKVKVDDGYDTNESEVGYFYMANRIPEIVGEAKLNEYVWDQDNNVTLWIESTDEDESDRPTTFYDIYLGDAPNATELIWPSAPAFEKDFGNSYYTSVREYNIGVLLESQTYYWKVVVTDGWDIVESNIWSFRTNDFTPPLIEDLIGEPSVRPFPEGKDFSISVKITDEGNGVQDFRIGYKYKSYILTYTNAGDMEKNGDYYSITIDGKYIESKNDENLMWFMVWASDGENEADYVVYLEIEPEDKEGDIRIAGFDVNIEIIGVFVIGFIIIVVISRKKRTSINVNSFNQQPQVQDELQYLPQQPPFWVCPNCGNGVLMEKIFCGKCGTKRHENGSYSNNPPEKFQTVQEQPQYPLQQQSIDYSQMDKKQLMELCEKRGLKASWWTADKKAIINYLNNKSMVIFRSETIENLLKEEKLSSAFEKFNVEYILGYSDELSKKITNQTQVFNIATNSIKLPEIEVSSNKMWFLNFIR